MPGLSSAGWGVIHRIVVRARRSGAGPSDQDPLACWSRPELYRALRERRPGVRVLFTSGYPQRELTPTATLDRDNFLPKPYTPAELARRVRELLDDAAVS
jgi:hypothetical protein